MKFGFNKKKDNQNSEEIKTEQENENIILPSTEDSLVEKTPTAPKTEWIWVTGYKGVTGDLKGYNNFQYEIGKTYEIEGDIGECKRGYHLCRRLKDVFYYYGITEKETVRYFKVSALVPKDKWEELPDKDSDTIKIIYNTSPYWSSNAIRFDKIAAKAIQLEEEVDIDTILSIISEIYPNSTISKYMDMAKDFYLNHLFGKNSRIDFLTKVLCKYGYTKEISKCIIEQDLFDAAIAFGSISELSIKEKLQFIFKITVN